MAALRYERFWPPFPNGRRVFLSLFQAIIEGTTVYSPLEVVESSTHGGMCVADIAVSLHIDHPCTRQLRLILYGPGPPNRGARPYDDSMPRSESAVLFEGHDGTDGGEGGSNGHGGCGVGIGPGLELSDSAPEGVWECCGRGR